MLNLVTEMPCMTLPPLTDHMIMDVTTVTFNSILTWSCSEGYELLGDSTMVCGEGGEWIGIQPWCESKSVLHVCQYLRSCKCLLFFDCWDFQQVKGAASFCKMHSFRNFIVYAQQ